MAKKRDPKIDPFAGDTIRVKRRFRSLDRRVDFVDWPGPLMVTYHNRLKSGGFDGKEHYCSLDQWRRWCAKNC
jgi:hypothetical protein